MTGYSYKGQGVGDSGLLIIWGVQISSGFLVCPVFKTILSYIVICALSYMCIILQLKAYLQDNKTGSQKTTKQKQL